MRQYNNPGICAVTMEPVATPGQRVKREHKSAKRNSGSNEAKRKQRERARYERVASELNSRINTAASMCLGAHDEMLFIAADVCANPQVYGREVLGRLRQFYWLSWSTLTAYIATTQ